MKRALFLLLLVAFAAPSLAQTVWHNPQDCDFNPIEGQYWQDEVRSNFYHRFPDSVEALVREPLWKLSTNCAGESINFKTNSPNITVRYTTTSDSYGMPHMPSTGVSGVDLYATDSNGEQIWLAARYTIGETCNFNYHGIYYREGEDGYSYRLFLPPYNGVVKLEIGVNEGSDFSFIEPRTELPIVAYGTSITQGACASRPAMIWTSIVSREMNMPLYNFGFSGNGLLENALIDLIADIPAAVYIIDCMPNLQHVEQSVLVDSIVKQVKRLRTLRPETPILLTDHLGYPHSLTIASYAKLENNAVESQRIAYERLIKEGVKDLYHLDYDTIGLPRDATVEAIHPTDWGMRVYGDAYVKMLNKILGK